MQAIKKIVCKDIAEFERLYKIACFHPSELTGSETLQIEEQPRARAHRLVISGSKREAYFTNAKGQACMLHYVQQEAKLPAEAIAGLQKVKADALRAIRNADICARIKKTPPLYYNVGSLTPELRPVVEIDINGAYLEAARQLGFIQQSTVEYFASLETLFINKGMAAADAKRAAKRARLVALGTLARVEVSTVFEENAIIGTTTTRRPQDENLSFCKPCKFAKTGYKKKKPKSTTTQQINNLCSAVTMNPRTFYAQVNEETFLVSESTANELLADAKTEFLAPANDGIARYINQAAAALPTADLSNIFFTTAARVGEVCNEILQNTQSYFFWVDAIFAHPNEEANICQMLQNLGFGYKIKRYDGITFERGEGVIWKANPQTGELEKSKVFNFPRASYEDKPLQSIMAAVQHGFTPAAREKVANILQGFGAMADKKLLLAVNKRLEKLGVDLLDFANALAIFAPAVGQPINPQLEAAFADWLEDEARNPDILRLAGHTTGVKKFSEFVRAVEKTAQHYNFDFALQFSAPTTAD